jgi:hypothetical protein
MIKIKKRLKSTISILLFISLIGITSADVQNANSSVSAYRTLPSDCIEPNAEFTVTVSASNYGTFGEVAETLCDEWTYTGSSVQDSQVTVSGNTVKFYLFGETEFTYTVRAPSAEGACCTISGILRDQDLNSIDIDGESDNTCTCPGQSSGTSSSSSHSKPSSTFTAQPTEESTVQPTNVTTETPTRESTDASPGGSGDNTTEETSDEGSSEEQDATPGFTVVTMLIAAVIGIILRSSTKK